MLVAIVAEKNIQAIVLTLQNIPQAVDIIELRLDFLRTIDLDQLAQLSKTIAQPYIITLRAKQHGGLFQGTEQQRLTMLHQLASLQPNYLDIESYVAPSWINQLHQSHPSIRLIRSYHHLDHTPDRLDTILDSMQHPGIHAYKIVTHAQSALDGLQMMHFVKQHSSKTRLVAHCTGPHGLPSRIIGAALGNCFSYAQAPDSNNPAPDCPDVDTMLHLYRIKKLNQHTKVYGLLGNPVHHSIGHFFHNRQFSAQGSNAVYIKIALNEKDIATFFTNIKGLPFKGFSVTMPLKEKIRHHLHALEANCQHIGAVNTINLVDGQWHGSNTDGEGAIKAIATHRPIAHSRVLIIGAGGAAKAIAKTCAGHKPMALTIVNRTLSKAKALAMKYGGDACDFTSCKHSITKPFDIIIHTIPHNDDSQAKLRTWLKTMVTPSTIVMPIDYSHTTCAFSAMAESLGCTIIDPKEMFYQQAQQQRTTWSKQDTVA